MGTFISILLIAGCVLFTAVMTIKLIKAIKERKERKKRSDYVPGNDQDSVDRKE